jgi:hypothetical protein
MGPSDDSFGTARPRVGTLLVEDGGFVWPDEDLPARLAR